MKKFWSILGVFFCLFVPPAYAGENIWTKSYLEIDGLKADQYNLRINEASCTINAFETGRLEIFVEDFEWPFKGSGAHQNVIIEKKGPILNTRATVVNKNGSIYFVDGGYDIFYVKFRLYAMDLPPEVRVMFHGQWGLE
jgi:hypothetical protein